MYPLGKGCSHSYEQTRIPFIQGCFVLILVENGPVLERSRKSEKFTDDRQTDAGRQVIRKAQLR